MRIFRGFLKDTGILYENSLSVALSLSTTMDPKVMGGVEEYSLKPNLNVLLHSTSEYHSALAENTFEYLAIEFPFKANHPYDRWLAGPLSLTLGLLVPSQVFNFFGSVSTFQTCQHLCIHFDNFQADSFPFCEANILSLRLRWRNSCWWGERRGGACCPRCKMEEYFSVVEVNWKLFKGNATPVMSGRRV